MDGGFGKRAICLTKLPAICPISEYIKWSTNGVMTNKIYLDKDQNYGLALGNGSRSYPRRIL
jgi:hypothetical protein